MPSRAQGKRLRPALVILAAKAVDPNLTMVPNSVIETAAAMELIHLASLIHDDVVDGAELRRNLPTINAEMGSSVSIIFGDWIYAKALNLIGAVGSADLFRCICASIEAMCQGELHQVVQRHHWDLSEQEAIDIARKKTGALFQASCGAGAILAGSHAILQEHLKDYGLQLGIGYQLADDYRDIACDLQSLGKHPGQDAKAGDVTLPLLHWQRAGGRREALEVTERQARHYLSEARGELTGLPDSIYRDSLLGLVDFFGHAFKAA